MLEMQLFITDLIRSASAVKLSLENRRCVFNGTLSSIGLSEGFKVSISIECIDLCCFLLIVS